MAERLVELGAGFDGEREERRVGGRDTGGGGGFSVGVVAEKLLSGPLNEHSAIIRLQVCCTFDDE